VIVMGMLIVLAVRVALVPGAAVILRAATFMVTVVCEPWVPSIGVLLETPALSVTELPAMSVLFSATVVVHSLGAPAPSPVPCPV
jgi:hypothetical protein